jgi:hypothetical protein
METFVLVPEKEFKKCENKSPDFNDSVAAVLRQPFPNEYKKAEALKNALSQFIGQPDDKYTNTISVNSSQALPPIPPPLPKKLKPIQESSDCVKKKKKGNFTMSLRHRKIGSGKFNLW